MNERKESFTYPIPDEKINDFNYDEEPGEYIIETGTSKDAAALLKQVIIKGYDPDRLAQEFLNTPSATWDSKGVSNGRIFYSEDVVSIFTKQVLEMLEKAER